MQNFLARRCEKLRHQIIAFHQDEMGDWVADLDCGHGQHVRHNPPWMMRPWVVTEAGRRTRVGTELECKKCDEEGPPQPH
jgi:hypothetical protein